VGDTATERPHLTVAGSEDHLTEDERQRRAHITEQLEGIAARFEERNSDLFPDGTGERAPVHQAADQWIAQFAQLGPTLTGLGEEYEGEVKLTGKITYDAKLEKWVASAKCDVPTIRTMKREPALAVAETGEDQGSAQLRLFNA